MANEYVRSTSQLIAQTNSTAAVGEFIVGAHYDALRQLGYRRGYVALFVQIKK